MDQASCRYLFGDKWRRFSPQIYGFHNNHKIKRSFLCVKITLIIEFKIKLNIFLS